MGQYVSPASKVERAVRAFAILQGNGDDAVKFLENGNIFVSQDSRERTVFPNLTCFVSSFDPTRGYRPEGVCTLELQFHLEAALQPNAAVPANYEAQRIKGDEFMSDVLDTFGIGSDETIDQDMTVLADAITAAGRWLATPDPNPVDAATKVISDQIVANNEDMQKFRVDWIRRGKPFHRRGKLEGESTVWVEIFNFKLFVSYSQV